MRKTTMNLGDLGIVERRSFNKLYRRLHCVKNFFHVFLHGIFKSKCQFCHEQVMAHRTAKIQAAEVEIP